MLPAFLLLTAAAAATPADGIRTFAVRNAQSDAYSADPATRMAWFHEEGTRVRLKYAERLGLNVDAIKASRKRSTVQVQNWGSSYSVQVDIGTPPQTFDTFIDTGSSDLWVVGRCQDPRECGMSKPFVPKDSSSFQGTGRIFNITYLKGETVGEWVEDVVSVGGVGIRTMFGLADYLTEWSTEQSALMGLGFQDASTGGEMPWWQAASANWTEKRWGMYLARTANWTDAVSNPSPQGGELTFGGIDRSKFYGDASFYSLASRRGLWTIPSQGIALQGRILDPTTVLATTDSGTSIIMGPDAAVLAFYRAIDPRAVAFSDGSWAYECGPGGNINASFAFGTPNEPGFGPPRLFEMWDGDLVFFSGTRAEFATAGVRLPPFMMGERYCIGNVMSWNDDTVSNYWLIGSPFLRNVYSIYETTPIRHGFAPLSFEFNLKYGDTYNPIQGGDGASGGGNSPHSPSAGGGNVTTDAGQGGGQATTKPSGAGRSGVAMLVGGLALAVWCL
ncbi:acid protease [Cutaneotrichosporon oleaginosum]|uniref:Acid protease n=1 Tax=Cutaneotrichosporon oleaginosum TaxID=879819 RepID=A0A0J0XZ72_9TREE|nr:acid protease [Cutaneotrichosporon oleaginosum]KLT46348.1 acid protease [Cutaneotrichosporon oleaginosum]TXT15280.1 hypothetical protein COLE_01473 [Cutaneotrichosporon oleaginosum]